MAKVSRRLQVTLPRAIAARYGIRPGDDIHWQPAGTVIQIVLPRKQAPMSLEDRLKLCTRVAAAPGAFCLGTKSRRIRNGGPNGIRTRD